MVGALWYLRATSIVGRIKSRLKRLKQPKYLAGAVVGALYIYFAFLRRAHAPQFGAGPDSSGSAALVPADWVPVVGGIAALVLLIVLAANWLIPRRAVLAFSESEIAFLFPAPVSRRMLVHYRVLGAQLGIFFTALIFTVVFGRGRGFGAHAWYQFISWWLVLALINLHFTGTSFVYSRLLNRSITSVRQRVITIAVGAAAVVALVVWIAYSVRLPTRTDFSSAPVAASYILEVLHAGPLPWLLALPKLVVAPYLATGLPDFALAMIPAVILLVVHYLWVVYTEVAFEEATIARAEKRAARQRASQQGDWRGNVAVTKPRTPAFALGSVGRPELAFLWKNLLATSALFRPKPILLLAVVVVGVTSWLSRQPDLAPILAVLSVVSLVILGMTVLLGPQIARQDLRTDLVNADILKTYPLRGWQIVLGEVLTPIAILSAVFWVALLTAYLSLPSNSFDRIPLDLRAGGALGLAVIAPLFIAIQVLMPNAFTVLFPAWVRVTRDQTERGIEMMGQRLIFVVSQVLVTALVLLPALIVGALLFFILNLIAGSGIGAAVALIGIAMLLGFEVWLGIRWLGNRFEAMDISSELRP
jgi:hypothetical protein